MSGRVVFQLIGAVGIVALLFVFVISPAVDRGGFGEIVIVAGIFAAVLLIERWLRTR